MFLVGPLIYLIFLICFILCVFLGYYIGKKKRSSLWGWGTFLISFGMIFGNEIYVHLQWSNMCSDAGLHVYKKVDVDGFAFRTEFPISLSAYDNDAGRYLNSGYKYIEARVLKPKGRRVDIQLYRYSMDHEGKVTRVVVPGLKSDYVIGYTNLFPVSDYIDEGRFEVKNRTTGELLGMFNGFYTRGGWLMNWLLNTLLSDKIGTWRICPQKGFSRKSLLSRTIPPTASSGVEK